MEPNANLAAHLRAAFGARLTVLEATFEEAAVGEDAFDLALAATSFHWVDQEAGLAKLGRAVRRGGAVALWWTLFQDPTAGRVQPRRRGGPGAPGPGAFEEPGRPPFQLDAEHRLRDLAQWGGFADLESEVLTEPRTLDAGEVRALYASVALVLRRSPAEQALVLDGLEALVRDRFGGRVERLFVTALYTGRRPAAAA